MEHRRKSGRAVHETFFLPSPSPLLSPSLNANDTNTTTNNNSESTSIPKITLLSEHPLFLSPASPSSQPTTHNNKNNPEIRETDLGGTFNLNLTAKQRRDREGVVLPYYDAQYGDGGGGEGGRILYEMGEEDDFDEEEDEI